MKASRRRRRPRRASVLRAAVLASLLAVTPATSSAQPTQAELQVLGLIGPVPTHWQPRPPASGMRLAEALVPPDAHFVVYYFGPGQGGTPALNIARWRSQFTVPGGGPVEPRIERFRGEGPPVTVVELRGDYARGIGTGDGNPRLPDHILRAGIVEAPRGSLFVHLYGPAATVARERGAFDRFLRNLRAAP